MKDIKIFKTAGEWAQFRKNLKDETLGFVPTMGALHAGHASLIRKSGTENSKTLVSIFVNPTQFNDPRDLQKYPRTAAEDLKLLKEADADYLLYPSYQDLYHDNYRFRVHEDEMSKVLCGAHRPGHFDGVLTVVLKLLNLVQAQKAYFGEKDFQQFLLIRDMSKAFFLPTEIISCPTVREEDGLALSSRNQLLHPEQRQVAPRFNKLLRSPFSLEEIGDHLKMNGFEVDYVEERWGRRFGAVRLGEVRLIDNVPV